MFPHIGPLRNPRSNNGLTRRRREVGLPGLCLVLLLAPGAPAPASTPLTTQLQVNTLVSSAQQRAAVASDAAGDFVVVWESYSSSGGDASARSIQARLFDAAGNPLGAEFQVNTTTANEQKNPAVARRPSGEFVVCWESNHADPSFDVILQRFSATGTKVGSEVLVNSTWTTGLQDSPSVAMLAGGDLMVVWRSANGAGVDIVGRRWSEAQTAFYDDFIVVNDVASGDQADPAIASDGVGRLLVAWTQPNDTQDVAVRQLVADESALPGVVPDGPQQQVNTFPTGAQAAPAVGMTADGRAVIAWDSFGASFGTDLARYSIQVRRLGADGLFIDGNDVQVNTYTNDDQRFSAVAVDGSGMFAVAWHSFGSAGGDASDFSVQLRAFDLGAQAVDPVDVQVNSYTTSTQWYPAVTFGSGGRLLVAWESNGSPGSDSNGFSVQARLYDVFLFADGFETGDVSRWSAATP